MSKLDLKKTLATLTPEQKDELILSLYSARKEAKEYLDFFINPDIDKLLDTTTTAICKEVYKRGKHGYNKPKISTIRNLIKKVATLGPGSEYVVRLYLNTIHAVALAATDGYWFTEAHASSFARLVAEALKIADDASLLEPTVAELSSMIQRIPIGPFNRAASFMRKKLSYAITDGLEAITGDHR